MSADFRFPDFRKAIPTLEISESFGCWLRQPLDLLPESQTPTTHYLRRLSWSILHQLQACLCLAARRHAPYLVQFQERAHAFQVLVATEKRARAEAEFSAQRRTGPPVVTIRRSQLLSDGFSQLNLVCILMLVRMLAFQSSTFAVCARCQILHCPVAIRRS